MRSELDVSIVVDPGQEDALRRYLDGFDFAPIELEDDDTGLNVFHVCEEYEGLEKMSLVHERIEHLKPCAQWANGAFWIRFAFGKNEESMDQVEIVVGETPEERDQARAKDIASACYWKNDFPLSEALESLESSDSEARDKIETLSSILERSRNEIAALFPDHFVRVR